MSGFAGIFFRDGKEVTDSDLSPLLDSIAHRGGDRSGTWRRGPCGLVHTALFSTPQSFREQYPASDPDGLYLLVADARLDDRENLARALGLETPVDELTDADLLLASYRRWGTDAAAHLLGDFSFAIWDESLQRLYCARDHFGVRPFCYHVSRDLFVFGSEVKPVLTREEVPRRINRERVAEYLSERFESKTATFYEGIDRLPAGCWLEVTRDRFAVHRYWELDAEAEVRLPSDQAYAERFRELLEAAVRDRLRTAYTPGALLSGGLDSSSNVVLARRLLEAENRGPLHTFTARFPEFPSADEGRYSGAVIEQGGVVPHEVHPGESNFLDDLDEMVWRHDGPIFWPTWVMDRTLFQEAREAGVRSLMSGHSGDLTISHGDGFFCELAMKGRWARLYREVSVFCDVRKWNKWSFLWREAVKPAFYHSLPHGLYTSIKRSRRKGTRVTPILNPDLDRSLQFSERMRERDFEDFRLQSTTRGFHYTRLRNDYITYSLEAGDRFDLSQGLRSTYPFFEKRLMEFGLALPPDQKLREGATRPVLRNAMAGLLPEAVRQRRSKVSLAPLVHKTFLQINRQGIDRFMQHELDVVESYIDADYLRRIYFSMNADNTLAQDSHFPILWQIMGPYILSRWIHQAGLAG